MVFVFLSHYSEWRNSAFLEVAEHLAVNKEWGIPYSALLAHTAFALPIKLSLWKLRSFHAFTFLILSPVPPEGGEQVAVWCFLPAGLKPWQEISGGFVFDAIPLYLLLDSATIQLGRPTQDSGTIKSDSWSCTHPLESDKESCWMSRNWRCIFSK